MSFDDLPIRILSDHLAITKCIKITAMDFYAGSVHRGASEPPSGYPRFACLINEVLGVVVGDVRQTLIFVLASEGYLWTLIFLTGGMVILGRLSDTHIS